jgi:PAS domain S-box-containing protein
MEYYQDELKRIREYLNRFPKGQTISTIASDLNLNRNTTSKYLDILRALGEAEMKHFGSAKVYYPAKRIPLSALIDLTNESIIIINSNLKIIDLNEEFLKIVKKSRDDLQGTNVLEISLPILNKSALKSKIKKALKGQEFIFDEKFIFPDNELNYFSINLIPVTFSDGEPGLCIVLMDITERKRAEIELKESEEKFRTFTEQSLMGIVIIQDDMVKYLNKAQAEMFEYNIDEVLNWRPGEYSKIFHPEDRNFMIQQAQKKQEGDPDVKNQYIYRGITKSGEVKWFELYSKTIMFEGKPADFITNIDITDKKLAEIESKKQQESRIESEKYLKKAQKLAHLGHWNWDIQKNTTIWSEELYKIFGVAASQFEPDAYEAFLRILHPEDRDSVVEVTNKAMKGETPFTIEYRIILPDQTVKYIKATGEVQFDEEGKPLKMFGISQDITKK